MKGKWLKALIAVACLTLAAGFSVSCKDEKTTGAVYSFNDPANEKYIEYIYTDNAGVEHNEIVNSIYTEEEGYILTSYSGSGAVEIPSEYNGKPVVAIGIQAFMNCTEVTSVVIPDTVKVIGWEAFFNCSSLTSVTIGDNVEKIGNAAFASCSSLTEVEIPASVTECDRLRDGTNGGGLFYDCDNLKNIRVHEDNPKYTSIDGNLYYKSGKNLTLVQYANGKTETSFTIPDDVTVIDRFAFGGNDKLTEIIMPDSVTKAREGAFYRCSKLEDIQFSGKLTQIARWTFYDCDSITEIELPQNLDYIKDKAFYSCDGLTEIVIPGKIDYAGKGKTTLEEGAFLECSNLRKVELKDGVKLIGKSVFQDCEKLAEINVPVTVETINNDAFLNCKSLTEITIPKETKTVGIDGTPFGGCDKLTVYCEVEAVKEMKKENKDGKEIEVWTGGWLLPDGYSWDVAWNKYKTIKVLDENGNEKDEFFFCPVVWNCKKNFVATDDYMYTVVDGVRYRVKDGVATVTKQGIGLEEAIIAETVTIGKTYNVIGIEEEAFYDCEGLTKVVIPESITSIGPWAFFGCYGLTVYCEADVQPVTWGDSWNLTDTPVVWGYNGEE